NGEMREQRECCGAGLALAGAVAQMGQPGARAAARTDRELRNYRRGYCGLWGLASAAARGDTAAVTVLRAGLGAGPEQAGGAQTANLSAPTQTCAPQRNRRPPALCPPPP